MNVPHGAPRSGLDPAEVAHRLATDGPNELPRPPRRTARRILLEIAREPMFQLLGLAVFIYLLLGDRAEASMLLAFLLIIIAITLIQERRTERVLETLRDMTSPRALPPGLLRMRGIRVPVANAGPRRQSGNEGYAPEQRAIEAPDRGRLEDR